MFKELSEADWGAIGAELLAFAAWRARNYRWAAGRRIDFAPGIALDDVVQRVIEKTLSGERRWDPQRGPLIPWLKDQVKSILDALAQSASSRYEMLPPGDNNEVEKRDAMQVPDPEKNALVKARIDALFGAVSDEPELEEIVEAIISGCDPTPRHLADELGVAVNDVNNRLKRLRRRVVMEDI